jgi:hypothetical protein
MVDTRYWILDTDSTSAISPNPKEGSECLRFPVKLRLSSEQAIRSPFLNPDVYDEGTF